MKNKTQIDDILKKVADKDGVSVKHVRAEIHKAISIGMSNSDPTARAFWMRIPRKSALPTPEEVLIFFSTQIDK